MDPCDPLWSRGSFDDLQRICSVHILHGPQLHGGPEGRAENSQGSRGLALLLCQRGQHVSSLLSGFKAFLPSPMHQPRNCILGEKRLRAVLRMRMQSVSCFVRVCADRRPVHCLLQKASAFLPFSLTIHILAISIQLLGSNPGKAPTALLSTRCNGEASQLQPSSLPMSSCAAGWLSPRGCKTQGACCPCPSREQGHVSHRFR